MKDNALLFTYRYRVKTSDLWQASMYYAYSSYMGVVNMIFIISSAALIVSRWKDASDMFRAVMLLMLLMFMVIQPLIIWMRAGASLKGVFPELELSVSREGITIAADGQRQLKTWDKVKGIVKKPTLIVIYMSDGNGYILRNSVLKDTRGDLYGFVNEMLGNHKK